MIFSQIFRLSFFKTIWINFRTQKLSYAWRMPILIGKGVIIRNIGKIRIENPKITGSLSIGLQYTVIDSSRNYGILDNHGILHIDGKVVLRSGVKMRIDRNASIYLGNGVKIGANNILISTKLIYFGEGGETSWNCQILDSDMHYMKNIVTGEVKDKTSEVTIKCNVWIGNNCIINKGAHIADNSIIASNSLVNKKFKQQNVILAGSPAKVVAENHTRVFMPLDEHLLNIRYNHI